MFSHSGINRTTKEPKTTISGQFSKHGQFNTFTYLLNFKSYKLLKHHYKQDFVF